MSKNKDKYKEYQKEYRKSESGKRAMYAAIDKYETTLNGMLMRLVTRAKARCKDVRQGKRQLVCEIDRDYLLDLWELQNGICAISGLKMDTDRESIKTVSLDRINSDDDYTKANTQLVCKWVNFGKRYYDNQKMLDVITEIKISSANQSCKTRTHQI